MSVRKGVITQEMTKVQLISHLGEIAGLPRTLYRNKSHAGKEQTEQKLNFRHREVNTISCYGISGADLIGL